MFSCHPRPVPGHAYITLHITPIRNAVIHPTTCTIIVTVYLCLHFKFYKATDCHNAYLQSGIQRIYYNPGSWVGRSTLQVKLIIAALVAIWSGEEIKISSGVA